MGLINRIKQNCTKSKLWMKKHSTIGKHKQLPSNTCKHHR